MFDLGLSKDDVKRVAWTVIQAGLAAAVLFASQQSQVPNSWSAIKQVGIGLALAFVAGVISAVKNLVLAPDSTLR